MSDTQVSYYVISGKSCMCYVRDGGPVPPPDQRIAALVADLPEWATVSCYYRDKAHERYKGRSTKSFHCRRLAIDVSYDVLDGDKRNEMKDIAQRHKVGGVGSYLWGNHLDFGPVRTWVGDKAGQKEAEERQLSSLDLALGMIIILGVAKRAGLMMIALGKFKFNRNKAWTSSQRLEATQLVNHPDIEHPDRVKYRTNDYSIGGCVASVLPILGASTVYLFPEFKQLRHNEQMFVIQHELYHVRDFQSMPWLDRYLFTIRYALDDEFRQYVEWKTDLRASSHVTFVGFPHELDRDTLYMTPVELYKAWDYDHRSDIEPPRVWDTRKQIRDFFKWLDVTYMRNEKEKD